MKVKTYEYFVEFWKDSPIFKEFISTALTMTGTNEQGDEGLKRALMGELYKYYKRINEKREKSNYIGRHSVSRF